MAAYPTVSTDKAVQAAYVKMRKAGQSHAMAEICACRKPPGANNTDRAFLQGRQNGEQLAGLPPQLARRAAAEYKKATGRSVPQGSVYISQLAKRPNDPRAFVDSLGDIKRRCEQTGAACEELGIKGAEVPPPEKQKLSNMLLKDHVQREVRKAVEENPKLRGKRIEPKKLAEMKEKIVHNHEYKVGG